MKTNNLISNLQNNIQKSENGKIFFLPSTDFSIFNNSENLHFVGFGGAGSNTIEYLHAKGIKAKFTCISNPVRPNISDEIDFIHYIYSLENQLPTIILDIFESDEKFIILSGIGGNTGTSFTMSISRLLHKKKIPFLTISSFPFKFESQDRNSLSNLVLRKLDNVPNFRYYTFPEIKALFNTKMNPKELFEKVNELIYELYLANKA